MLEPPPIAEATLIDCLRIEYGISAARIAFLPLGADTRTAVYRVVGRDGTPYFLKLRRDLASFDALTVVVPHRLHEQGMPHLIPPLTTLRGEVWTPLDDYAVTLYPFVEGQNGFKRPLTEEHWRELGAALRALHDAALPAEVAARLPRETWSDRWREAVRACQRWVETDTFAKPWAAKTAELVRTKRDLIDELVSRAERYAAALSGRALEYVPCHADIHGANVLIDGGGRLYVVDWDTLILAPRERDLMFVGAGIGGFWDRPEEAPWFDAGYGAVTIDRTVLAYYRCERVVEDIAAYAGQLLDTDTGGADRPDAYRRLSGILRPDMVTRIALRTAPRPDAEGGS